MERSSASTPPTAQPKTTRDARRTTVRTQSRTRCIETFTARLPASLALYPRLPCG